MKKKSKKRKKKIVIKKFRLLVFLSIIIAAIILISTNVQEKQKQSKAINTVSTYMSYINESKYDEMYKMLASTSKNNITEEQFIERNQGIYEQLEVSGVTVSNMTEEEENRKNQNRIYNKYGNISRKSNFCKYYKTYWRR